MNDKNIKPGALTEGILDPTNAEMQQLLARMDGMQMEIDILKETINVLKKRPRHQHGDPQKQGEGSDR